MTTCLRHQVHARLDDGLAASLRREVLLDRREDFIVGPDGAAHGIGRARITES
jgi:hypothetical protein